MLEIFNEQKKDEVILSSLGEANKAALFVSKSFATDASRVAFASKKSVAKDFKRFSQGKRRYYSQYFIFCAMIFKPQKYARLDYYDQPDDLSFVAQFCTLS